MAKEGSDYMEIDDIASISDIKREKEGFAAILSTNHHWTSAHIGRRGCFAEGKGTCTTLAPGLESYSPSPPFPALIAEG